MSALKDFFLDLVYLTDIFLSSAGGSFSATSREVAEILAKEYEEREARRLLWRLKQRELITTRKRGNEVIIKLTDKGKIEALKLIILNKKTKLPAGTCCLVSFDIPEVTKKTRWFLRHFLKEAKFRLIHRSVWSSNRAITNELRSLVRELKIDDWVKIFEAKE